MEERERRKKGRISIKSHRLLNAYNDVMALLSEIWIISCIFGASCTFYVRYKRRVLNAK